MFDFASRSLYLPSNTLAAFATLRASLGSIECGGYGQVGRPTDAGREGGRRAVVRASPPALQDTPCQLSLPHGASAGRGGRLGARSVFESVSSTKRLCAERQIYDVALPDCDKFGVELRSGQPSPANGNLTRCAGDRGCGRWR